MFDETIVLSPQGIDAQIGLNFEKENIISGQNARSTKYDVDLRLDVVF